MLALDEMLDGGVIMEIEPATILSHITRRRAHEDKPESMQQLLQTATEKVAKSLLK